MLCTTCAPCGAWGWSRHPQIGSYDSMGLIWPMGPTFDNYEVDNLDAKKIVDLRFLITSLIYLYVFQFDTTVRKRKM